MTWDDIIQGFLGSEPTEQEKRYVAEAILTCYAQRNLRQGATGSTGIDPRTGFVCDGKGNVVRAVINNSKK